MLRVVAALTALNLCFTAAADDVVIRTSIHFDPDTVYISSFAKTVIQKIAADVASHSYPRVVLVGHCDTADKAPMLLSRLRAKAIADELRKDGVPKSVAIEVSGVGTADLAQQTGPNVPNIYNRRVTIAY
jgi:outer membrane protein OmpA-like peptidoglycan-associated protein